MGNDPTFPQKFPKKLFKQDENIFDKFSFRVNELRQTCFCEEQCEISSTHSPLQLVVALVVHFKIKILTPNSLHTSRFVFATTLCIVFVYWIFTRKTVDSTLLRQFYLRCCHQLRFQLVNLSIQTLSRCCCPGHTNLSINRTSCTFSARVCLTWKFCNLQCKFFFGLLILF